MLVFDLDSPLPMFQILRSILSVPAYRKEFLKDHYVLVTPQSRNQGFKRLFMNEYRKEHHLSPLSKAYLILKGGNRSFLGISVIVYNDDFAVDHLYAMETNLRQRLSNIRVEIRGIDGGELHTKNDLEYEKLTFGPDKYDSHLAQEQFLQQRSLGRQSIFQLELDDEENFANMPSLDELGQFLEKTLSGMGYSPHRFDKFTNVGDGGVIVSMFSQGNVILIFDGSMHVDINLFSFDESKGLADSFIDKFLELSDGVLERSLREDQPRGIGRVVNFSSE
jgi:hypothetical protein